MDLNEGQELQRCIDACLACYRTCQQTAMQHCLEVGGPHVEAQHMRLMNACAEVCRASAHVMLAGIPQHAAVCAACAQICRACAESCEDIGDMDECVRACRECAQSCEEMSGGELGLASPLSPAQANPGQLAM
ncbi:MAG TPA: four-helix bundle copper-binding protein [Noviherbaspirillum sp.]|nr:four-helix bundle copper-binding protein [Noviherbaspirillum sp.]